VRIAAWRFVLADAIGAALWSGVALALGYVFRDAIDDVVAALAAMGRIGIGVILAVFALYLLRKWWERRRFMKQLEMDRVSVDELRALIDAGRMGTVIDVRSPLSQSITGRIPGAITVDADNLQVALSAVAPEGEVVVYCACPNEATAAKVAKALVRRGFKRVRPLRGGIDAWIAAGLDVER
jgi:rhodanese-related sulfurtransferase